MHFDFHFTAVQILWTLTFAAQLVLLVVLIGRDRMQSFPWFTTAVVLLALRLLSSRLLFGKLPQLTLSTIFIALADIAVLVALLVLVEMARRSFTGVKSRAWIIGTLAMFAVAGVALYFWGPWPPRDSLKADSFLGVLGIGQLFAQKADMLVDMLAIELGVVVVLFGRRYNAGWRSHPQQIVVGLSTAAMAQLLAQGIWQIIAHTATPHSQAEYQRVVGLRDKLFNASGATYVAILVWWIVCLWRDEQGKAAATPVLPSEAAVKDENPPDDDFREIII